MRQIAPYVFLMAVAWLLQGCSNTRNLPKGERLFRGSKVVINDNDAGRRERKVLKNDLAGLVRPRPNSKFLGFRLKLSLYNLAGKSKSDKGIKGWLRNKAGQPPVLASSVHLDANKKLMVNYLQNRGYFDATAKAEFNNAVNKKSQAVFNIYTGPQYTINKVEFRKDTTALISRQIDSDFNKTMLQPGNPYNLDVIKAERERIDRLLKEKGYYYFKPDYILVVVDSSIGNHKVNMYVKLKHREIPPEAYRPYSINDIFIYASYRLRASKDDTDKKNKVKYDSYYVIDNMHAFKPRVLADAMVFEKGDLYSLDDQNKSLSRLVNLGTFKFVKNRFEPVDDTLLDTYYYLTTFPRKSLRFELGALTQSDNRTGTRGSLSWRNRNAFKGAEELLFKLNAGIETQYGAVSQAPIYNFAFTTQLSYPRFVVPFVDVQNTSRYLPRTIFKASATYETELTLLNITSFTASYGFDWKVGMNTEHQLYPINFMDVRTDTLQRSDALRFLYSALIFNGVIIGPTYEYTFNSQIGPNPKSGFYFDGLIDLSGVPVGAAQPNSNSNTGSSQIFGGLLLAQYIKLQPDLRYYWHVNPNATVAMRALVGIGVPYGSSTQLPNIKEFWAGGNSDLRGFPSRLVGPGTFNEYAVYHTSQYLETLGDMKLEFNAELRQNVYKFVNIGLFGDAGNIWLYNANPAYPGGQFTSNFLSQLAADVGAGLRLDFGILLLRLDLGVPVLKPWQGPSSPSSTGLPQNVVINIAIGYPF